MTDLSKPGEVITKDESDARWLERLAKGCIFCGGELKDGRPYCNFCRDEEI